MAKKNKDEINTTRPKPYRTKHQLPTALEREVLTIMGEECNEVCQRISKFCRFGAKESQPGQQLTNSQRLSREIGQLLHMIEMSSHLGLVNARDIEIGNEEKPEQLRRFMQNKLPKVVKRKLSRSERHAG